MSTSLFVVVTCLSLSVGLLLFWVLARFENHEGLAGRWRQLVALVRVASAPAHPAGPLYTLWDGHDISSTSRFLNLGYWAKARNIDEAAMDLAELLGQKGRLGPGDRLLDVGFGYADQDLLWVDRFRPRSIIGVNISRHQVAEARRRVEARGLTKHVDLRVGSATALPFSTPQFDVLTALECAFHFDTREDFFREANRVLIPGGRIALADLVVQRVPRGKLGLALDRFRARFWQIPEANLLDQEQYRASLERAGFTDVVFEVISDRVLPPLRQEIDRRMKEPEVRRRIHPLHRNRLSEFLYKAILTHDRPFSPFDYVIVTARRRADEGQRP